MSDTEFVSLLRREANLWDNAGLPGTSERTADLLRIAATRIEQAERAAARDQTPSCTTCEIIERIRASFDAETRAYFTTQADPLTHILDNEGPEALVEAILNAAEEDDE